MLRFLYIVNGNRTPSAETALKGLSLWSKINPEMSGHCNEAGTHPHKSIEILIFVPIRVLSISMWYSESKEIQQRPAHKGPHPWYVMGLK